MPAQYKTPRLKYAAWLVMALPAVWIMGRFAADIILLGWLALAIFIPLAVTSHNRAVKAMGARWSALHRSVYIAAALTFAHAILSSGRPALSYSLLAVWLAAIAARMLFKKRS